MLKFVVAMESMQPCDLYMQLAKGKPDTLGSMFRFPMHNRQNMTKIISTSGLKHD